MSELVEAQLPEFFEFIRNGMSVKQDKSGSGLPITRIETIWNGEVDSNRFGYAGIQKSDASKWLLKRGDILFSHINSVDHIGKCALFDSEHEVIHGMNLLCFRPNFDLSYPNYIKWLFRSQSFRSQIMPFVNKAVNQASISIGNLSTIRIRMPALSEQKRIAAILDQADELRRKRQRAINRLNQLGQAIFHEMFGDPVANDRGWPMLRLGKVSRNITDGTHDTPTRTLSGIPFITSKNVRPFEFDMSNLEYVSPETHREIIKRCNPQHGDILYTNIGASVGSAVQNRFDFEFSLKNVALIQPDHGKLLSDYLEYMLNNPRFKESLLSSSAAGGAQKFVTLKALRNAPVPIPPVSAQEKFAERVEAMAIPKAHMAEQQSAISSVFAALQHRAFQGAL